MKRVVKVCWTENAIQSLETIKEFISQDSTNRAEQWVHETIQCWKICVISQCEGELPEFNKENLRELIIESIVWFIE